VDNSYRRWYCDTQNYFCGSETLTYLVAYFIIFVCYSCSWLCNNMSSFSILFLCSAHCQLAACVFRLAAVHCRWQTVYWMHSGTAWWTFSRILCKILHHFVIIIIVILIIITILIIVIVIITIAVTIKCLYSILGTMCSARITGGIQSTVVIDPYTLQWGCP